MAAIKTDFGTGGSGLTPSGQDPYLASALRDVADDLADLVPTAAASADATDLASAITLVNELKGIVNVLAAVTIRTTKG